MKDLVIGDLHFGIKTNSITWLDSQINFFKKQIFKIINNELPERIIFLGDLFDIRYAVNQQIGYEVKKLLRELGNLYKNPIIFVAGNHDYYSPLEEFSEYNIYNLIFGEEWNLKYPNFKFVNKDPYFSPEGTLFLPWYYTENEEHFDEILYQFKMGEEVKCIYCHTDLTIWPGPKISSLKGIPVYSGHIHFPVYDNIANLYNLGAALPLTFNDVNDYRYIYIIEDFKITKKIKNEVTPLFKRYFNDEIFELTGENFNNSYVQLYISSSYINTAEYIETIKNLKTSYYGSNITIRSIDELESVNNVNEVQGFNTNIRQYIEDNVPDYLSDKYNLIKNKITENK